MPNIRYYVDSEMYHLAPMRKVGFFIPDELWDKYLKLRDNWQWNFVDFLKVRNEIEAIEKEWKVLTKIKKCANK